MALDSITLSGHFLVRGPINIAFFPHQTPINLLKVNYSFDQTLYKEDLVYIYTLIAILVIPLVFLLRSALWVMPLASTMSPLPMQRSASSR